MTNTCAEKHRGSWCVLNERVQCGLEIGLVFCVDSKGNNICKGRRKSINFANKNVDCEQASVLKIWSESKTESDRLMAQDTAFKLAKVRLKCLVVP